MTANLSLLLDQLVAKLHHTVGTKMEVALAIEWVKAGRKMTDKVEIRLNQLWGKLQHTTGTAAEVAIATEWVKVGPVRGLQLFTVSQ